IAEKYILINLKSAKKEMILWGLDNPTKNRLSGFPKALPTPIGIGQVQVSIWFAPGTIRL
ncbi:MAG: hypothetical protein OES12_07280, partial [Anaerolineae bacterium]|nr:hypothetical protein [Anaerolineae bacterium]